jgi:hypothetical protein
MTLPARPGDVRTERDRDLAPEWTLVVVVGLVTSLGVPLIPEIARSRDIPPGGNGVSDTEA